MRGAIDSTLWLAALCFAPLPFAATVLVLFRSSKKPHYRTLFRRWGRVAAGFAFLGAILTLVSLRSLGLAFGASARVAFGQLAHRFGAAVGVVGLAGAAAYARVLLRAADDYSARSGFRIGASVALVGLLAQLPLCDPSARMFGIALLVGAASLVAIERLWRSYAREPAWLLWCCVVVLPIAAAAIVVVHVSAQRPVGTSAVVEAVLAVVAVLLLLRLARRRSGGSRYAL